MMGITGALSTLEITERSAPQKTPLLSGRSPKFLRLSDDETETSEQPIDFSKKYCETKVPEKSFDIYAETDLDQPTDYSLRYAEGDKNPRKQKNKSEFSSGLMSPEEPVNYCEEGTPGYFSRVPSCGSLNSISDPKPPEKAPKEERPKTQEPKAVKFEEVVNYAEETPLMFSRSSSLASLDSIEQHSIHDDRSSVVSDFSRLTSGVISPSELPDSPSQTMPPSPRPRKTAPAFPEPKKEPPKLSVFEDDVKKFKVESTPIQFSTATSLSSLDEVDSKEQIKEEKPDLGESSDEDILEACINRGITNNRYNQVKAVENASSGGKYENLAQPEVKTKFDKNDVSKFDKNDVSCDSLRTYCTEGTPAILSHAGSNTDLSALSIHFSEKESVPEPNNDTHVINIAKENSGENSQNSSFSSLTDESESEALLEECILAGMPKSNPPKKSLPTVNGETQKSLDELSDLSDEDDILENCIKIGIENNKYSQLKIEDELKALVQSEVGDTVKSYCTEDTPAGLSKAGSCSNLSVLSVQDNGANLTDIDSEDEEELLRNCMKFGMAAIAQRRGKDGAGLNKDTASKPRDYSPLPSDAGSASFSEDSESDEALLQQCIQAGMPKPKAPPPAKPPKKDDLTPAEKELLEKCILEGMRKCQTPKKAEDESSELTEAEHALLRQCILAGMQKSKNLARGGVASASGSRESTELTESERLLLQQCILAGMPKSRKSVEVGKGRREKEERGHTCCVHCPRNKEKVGGHSKGKRRGRERVGHREDRDVSIVYVASQILAVKKEVTRSEKWV